MTNQSRQNKINKDFNSDDLLKDLFQFTPSSINKLIAAWDDLSLERKIYAMKHYPGSSYVFLLNRIYEKALQDKNAYIRYLAALKLDPRRDNEDVKKQILNDTHPLVRNSLIEADWSFGSTFKWTEDTEFKTHFFSLEKEGRLAIFRTLHPWDGEKVASLIKYALAEEKLSKEEILELLEDYTGNATFKEAAGDGYGEYTKGLGIKAMWDLCLEHQDIAYTLIKNLPRESWFSTESELISEEIIKSLSPYDLDYLLYRPDIHIREIRKKLFSNTKGDRFKFYPIIDHAFDLNDEEFEDLISEKNKPDNKEKIQSLIHAKDLNQRIYEKLIDYLKRNETEFNLNDFDDDEIREKKYAIQQREDDESLDDQELAKNITVEDLKSTIFSIQCDIENLKDHLSKNYGKLFTGITVLFFLLLFK